MPNVDNIAKNGKKAQLHAEVREKKMSESIRDILVV